MSITIDTPYGAAVELADVAGLGMADDQRQSLAALLATTSTGTWAAPDVEARSDAETDRYMDAVLHARCLYGLLGMDERIVWTTSTRLSSRLAFEYFVDRVDRVRLADPSLAGLKKCRRNGEERVWRAGTAGSVRFTTHRSGIRGYTFDTAIVVDAHRWTQTGELLPCMASTRNPQLIRA